MVSRVRGVKRILFITRDESYPGGTEEFIKNLLISLSKQKFVLKLFLLEIEGHGKFENINVYAQLKKANIEILSISSNSEDIASPDKILELTRVIKEYKIDIVHSFLFNADFLTCIAKIGSERMWYKLTRIKSFSDLINIIPSINNLKTVNLQPTKFVWISSKLIDVSIALEKNTDEWIKRKAIIDNELEKIVSSYADEVLPVCKNGLGRWEKLSKKITLLPCVSITKNDLDEIEIKNLKRDEIRKKYGISSNKRVFVTVTRLVPEKGIDKLINLFMVSKGTNDVLYIAGSGFLEKKLKTQAGGHKDIRFLGYLDRNRIFDILVAGDVFVLLSKSEGFPLAIQEAMAAAKPILATNVGGVPDLVAYTNGKLCKFENKKSIDKAFQWFKKQKDEKLISLGNNSKLKLQKYFMVEKTAEKLANIYLRS